MKSHGVKLDAIRIDGGTQPRTKIDTALVTEYAQLMTDGVVLPPVVVFFDGVNHWLADGFHRYHAAKKADWRDIGADIHEGTQRDAVLFSVGANSDHGQRRTGDDIRKAIVTLVMDSEWGLWSNSEIVRRVGAKGGSWREFVAAEKARHLPGKASEPRTYTTKHGTKATMETANIGRKNSTNNGAANATSDQVDAPFKSRRAVEKRRQRIKEMAVEGYSIEQVSAEVGVSQGAIRLWAKSAGVEFPANKAMGKPRRHDPNRIVSTMVMQAEHLTSHLDLIDFSRLNHADLPEWIAGLTESAKQLSAFIKDLKKELHNHGQAA